MNRQKCYVNKLEVYKIHINHINKNKCKNIIFYQPIKTEIKIYFKIDNTEVI